MRWLRLYDDTINDPKILKLPEATRWHWIALLCIASKNDGALPPLDDIAIQLRVTPAKATEIIAALVRSRLLDKAETGFVPHNWDGRQYKSDVSTDRVKRFRNGKRNVSSAVSETPCSVSVSDTVSESLSKKEDPEFVVFWEDWPNKVGKPAAVKALAAARKRGAPFGEIMDGVRSYIRDKPPDRPWLNPATFLNQDRWADQPAPPPSAAKPLTEFQLKQRKTSDVTEQLKQSALAERSGGSPDRFLSHDHGERS